jgi:hypothetical protein
MEKDMATACKLGLLAVFLLTFSWGSDKTCQLVGLTVSPATATADHAAVPPANQVQFFAAAKVPKGCSIIQCVNCFRQTWSVSDPVKVSISNNASDNGTATCLGATNGAVTVSATAPVGSNQTVTGTASLTCR